jgi:DNA-binding transcriptional LysR family regulator
MKQLRELDLNLLVVFQQLVVDRRVSRAAEHLGLTQPAVSNALARLRRHFSDDLFLRTPAGMVPTPRAEELAGPVGDALALLHQGLNQPQPFDPARERRAVTLGMTDIGEIVFLPALVERLARTAPGVTLSTVRNSQRYVCLYRRGHRLDGRRLTTAAFRTEEHLVVVSPGTGHGQVDQRVQRAGVQRTVRLTVPHFVSVGHLLQATDLVATVPERLADNLAGPFSLAWQPHPLKLPAIGINAFWHAKAHRSPLNQWLRAQVFELFAEGG